jgi:uncharacterized protein YbjT (DUF2867 family)
MSRGDSPPIFLLGATGATGKQLSPILLREGYKVVALVRSIAKIPNREGLQVS